MSHRTVRARVLLFGAVSLLSLLSCGREPTGPGARGRIGQFAFEPVFQSVRLGGTGQVLSISDVVAFTAVRVVLLRANGDTAVDRVVNFPADSQSVSLTVNVALSAAATAEGEPLSATLKYVNAAGDTVFTGGPVTVLVQPPGSAPAPPPQIPVNYTGPGANAASIVITPASQVGTVGTNRTFAAEVRDAQGSVLVSAPIAFTSTDSARVRVDLRSGVATLLGARGGAQIIAQTLTGQADTADVTITPTASAIAVASGAGQVTRQGDPFPAPVRIRVTAVDGLAVSGVPVTFAVTRGQGSATPTAAVTDANGFAETNWTAGDSAGVGQLTATVNGAGLAVTVSGTQLSSAPTALTFETQPVNFTAGDTIPPLTVVVRDATADTVAGFTGTVTLDLTGGNASGQLYGTLSREAANGVVTFPGLTIDRAGTAYRIRATVNGVPPVTTNAFNVAAAPARTVSVTAGNGQTAPPQTELPDTIRVRVTDVFGAGVPGVTVTFAVTAGGGSVVPASAVTDAAGEVRTRWTLGPSGAQQLTAGVAGLTSAVATATVFTGGGSPVLFAGVPSASLIIGGSRTIPVFVNPAAVAPITATLVVRDTLVARWAVDSVVFTAGATLRSPLLTGVAQGSTYAVITSSAGTDSVLVDVQPASLNFLGNYSSNTVPGDTLRTAVILSAPAPTGGVVVAVASPDTAVALVAPAEGNGEPEDRCNNYYCYGGVRSAGDTAGGFGPRKLLAPPADTAFLTIPEGQTVGHFAVITRNPGDIMLVATAANYALAQRNVFVGLGQLSVQTTPYSGIPLGVGTRTDLRINLFETLRRPNTFRLTVRDTSVLQADSTVVALQGEGNATTALRLRSPGATWIVAEGAGFLTDSTRVEVVTPYLRFSDRFPVAIPGSALEMDYSSTDSSGSLYAYWAPEVDHAVSLTSSDTTVVRADLGDALRAGEYFGRASLRAVGAGRAWIRIAAAGYVPDSVEVTVQRGVLSVYDNANGVGTGQVHSSYSVYLYGGQNNALSGAITYTVTSSDPAIATVLTPTVTTPSYGYLYAPRILGRAPGTVTLTWAGADFDTITTNFTVRTPELLLQNFTFASTFEADSAQYNVFANAVHSGGYAGPVDDTVFAVVRSTDPAVVQVTDSVLRFNPGTYFSNGGRVRMIGPGTARLIVSAPGYTPDTTAVITLRPYRLDVSAGIVAFGRGLEMTLPVVRRAWTGAALPFTASISGPAGMTVVETSPSFAAGANLAQLTLRSGTATGSDFLIVAAAGLAPDTVRFDVGPSAILTLANGFLYVGEDAEVGARLRPAGTFAYYPPSDSVRLLLQVRDSTLLSAVADTVVFVRGSVAPTLTATVRGLRPGAGWVILSDPSGRFAADSAFVTVGRQELQLGRSSVEIGMQQETYAGELYFYRPSGTTDSLWVRLGSSAPGVVQPVQDSVLIAPGAYYGYFEIAAGDSVGGAVITGSAPGYLDFALPVRVSQTKLELILDYDVVPGQGTGASLYLNNASSYEARATRVAVPVRLDVEDTTVVRLGADSLVAIAAGASSAFPGEAFIGVATGRTRVFASDPRTGVFQQALNAWTTTDVHQPRLTASGGGVLILTPGATTSSYYVQRDYGIRSAIWVQARSVGGRFRVDGDSVFLGQNSTSEYFSLTGLSAGTDTLVLSAPGYTPDTVVVRLEPGILEASSLPSSLAAGDSVRVTVYLRNANGAGTAVADTPLTVTFGATGAIVPRDDQGGTLTEGVLPPGEVLFQMWVVATGTGGGEIVISAPGFQPLRFRINTRGTPQ